MHIFILDIKEYKLIQEFILLYTAIVDQCIDGSE